MALDLLKKEITPVDGLYTYMPNTPQPHNAIVSDLVTDDAPLKAGDLVTYDTTATNSACPVIKKAGVTDPVCGIIPFDMIKNTYYAKEEVMFAIEGSYIYKKAAGPIAQGAKLYFNANMEVTSTATAGNSIVGIANTYVAAAQGLVQVKIKPESTTAASN